MSPLGDVKRVLVVSREQQEPQEEGVKVEALRQEMGRVMLILGIFTYQGILENILGQNLSLCFQVPACTKM